MLQRQIRIVAIVRALVILAALASGALLAAQVVVTPPSGGGGSSVTGGSCASNRYATSIGTDGSPTCAQVNAAAGITGNLPVANLNSGTSASSSTFWRGDGSWVAPTVPHAIGITIDGAGAAITTGFKGFAVSPVTCTINQATLLSTDASVTSGSIVIDVWKDTYANYPPTVADTITASAKPTLSSATKAQDSTLTGWTTSVTAGDVIGFNVDSASSVTRVQLMLRCQ